MSIKLFLHLTLAVMLCDMIDTSDVYVSKRNGEDNTFCGTYLNPCNTLEFAVKKKTFLPTTVQLDGGTEKTYVYYVNSSIILKASITITSYGGNKIRPIIKTIHHGKYQKYLFRTYSNKHIYLKIEHIHFIETPILDCNSSFNRQLQL